MYDSLLRVDVGEDYLSGEYFEREMLQRLPWESPLSYVSCVLCVLFVCVVKMIFKGRELRERERERESG